MPTPGRLPKKATAPFARTDGIATANTTAITSRTALWPRPPVHVDEVSHRHFEQRNRRRQGRHRQEHEEGRPKQLPAWEGGEQPGKHREDQTGPAGARVESGNREPGRKDDEAGQQGNGRVEHDDPRRGRDDPLPLGQIASIRDHGSHAQAERKEGLAERGTEHPDIPELAEIGSQVIGESLRGPWQRHGPRRQDHEQHEQHRHHGLRHALDARSDTPPISTAAVVANTTSVKPLLRSPFPVKSAKNAPAASGLPLTAPVAANQI